MSTVCYLINHVGCNFYESFCIYIHVSLVTLDRGFNLVAPAGTISYLYPLILLKSQPLFWKIGYLWVSSTGTRSSNKLHWLDLTRKRTDSSPGIIFHHDDVIKWKYFPCHWPFVRGYHRSPVDSPHKGRWRGSLRFSLICAWTNGRANNRGASDLRHHRAIYDVTVMMFAFSIILRHS